MLNPQQPQAHRWRRGTQRRVQIVATHFTREDGPVRLIRVNDPNLDDVDLGQIFEHLPDCNNRIGDQPHREEFRFSPGGQIAIPWVDIASMPFDLQRERCLPEPQTVIGYRSTRRQCEGLDDSIPQPAPFPFSSPLSRFQP
jgi:hypothetical protein